MQSLELLPNGFGVKYTSREFLSPQGHSYHGTGIKPDVEVRLAEDLELDELRLRYPIVERVARDAQLKVAVELLRVM